MRPKITHVIFDLDGVLIDSERINFQIYQKLWSKYGKTFTPELMLRITGTPVASSASFLIQHFDMERQLSVQEYRKHYNALADEFLPKCPIIPGVMRLVRHLAKHKIHMAVCTSSSKIEFNVKTAMHSELFSLIPLIVLAGDDPEIKRGKPAPDPFLVTMNRFKEKAENAVNVLVFEDSANGVRSAIAAGMQVVMIPDMSYMKPPEEVIDKIGCILKSFEEFKPESMGLPPYD
ncbi:HAD hydrolase, family IA, variant 3 [Onchocerca flexuosa]|uniref:HAD hydrolase, family IA, variant 3 n=1 Tax=Onchocerca flexuosa TaxID=387005 RepID=A0A238BJI0_9BILA|nr:HAD hydrolase, family IA, variant 3 [Onchocerca flexuosa]